MGRLSIVADRSHAHFVRALAFGVLVIVGPAACSHASPKVGTISGLASPCIGVAKPGQASVTIYAKRGDQVVASRRVVLTKSPGNPYKLMLAPGAYVLSAPKSLLPARTVKVRAGQTTTVNFLPSCK